MILISPWFDGKMSNKDISFIKDNDFILNKDNCYLLSLHVYSKYQNALHQDGRGLRQTLYLNHKIA